MTTSLPINSHFLFRIIFLFFPSHICHCNYNISFSLAWRFIPLSFITTALSSYTTSLAYWIRCPPWERKIPGSNPTCAGVESYQWPKNIGSVLGQFCPVSVYCDWVRWKVWSATSISVWQHIKLSEQIRPWDTLACCCDVKQASNQSTASYCMCKFVCLHGGLDMVKDAFVWCD